MKKRGWLREPFCGASHFVGAVLSVAALAALLIMARGRPLYVAAFSLYGASLIALYASSALYHSLHVRPEAVAQWQRMDYAAIFLLIAGTYTPVCLIALRGRGGAALLTANYAVGAAGILMLLFWKRAPHGIRVALYIVMGWMAVLAWPQLKAVLPPAALAWLVAGGLAYTLGTAIYATDRPHLWPGKFSAHDLWHLFVMAGSMCHFALIYKWIR